VVLAAVGGITVAGIAVVLSAARVGPAAVSAEFIRLAPGGAGATNVVSAIIVDFRALDTVGEIGVLFIAAAGVSSLVLATRYDTRRKRPDGQDEVLSGQSDPEHEREVLG
jgi:multicomponent Na+:H+ antiporter subunit A